MELHEAEVLESDERLLTNTADTDRAAVNGDILQETSSITI